MTQSEQMARKLVEKIQARPTSDGAGVKLQRVFSGPRAERFDPFLMLDEFGSESADDYIAGFPPHPHRGFETITYMLQGKMEHQDHMGNIGLLSDGGVQWMTAGRGVIHSEMPKQTEGKMHGFQLWLNLASGDKMQAACYEDIEPDAIPNFDFDDFNITAIAGQAQVNGQSVQGKVQQVTTEPTYFDFQVSQATDIEIEIASGQNCLLYCYQGAILVSDEGLKLNAQELGRLTKNGTVKVNAEAGARFLLIAGQPLNEPIAQHGPFVMNTFEEIEQAIYDYQNGQLTA